MKEKFRVFLSHDVDHVEKQLAHYWYYFLKQKRFFHLSSFFYKKNFYWCFDEILNLENKYGVKSTFYFLNETIKFNLFQPKTWFLSLGKYRFSDLKVSRIMRKLDRAGWEIGLHGSYNSFLDQEMLACEKKLLEDVLGHKVIGIRQHHLNLQGKETWQYQKNVGFKYDSSFGYKGKIGFKENKYQPFYPIDQSFMVIPLALMDGNVIDSQYVIDKSNEDRIWQKCLTVINEAQKNKAVLSVLWHTRFFADKDFPGCAKMYERIIIECQKRGAEFLTGENILKEYGGN